MDKKVKELAERIIDAVYADEQSEGCDISAGLFGPKFSELVRELASLTSDRPSVVDCRECMDSGVVPTGDGYSVDPCDCVNAARALDRSSVAPVRELSDAEIVKVLASLGIDADKSKYGFPELQVHTTVPSIRQIVARYLAALDHPSDAQEPK
jgi:hypothetical protein